jgi:serine/threonine protein kinase
MPIGEIISGQMFGWSIRTKLGEGDAGEAYLVESLSNRQQAILKRPRKSAFSSDIIRQANQIQSEGRVLRAFNGLTINHTDISIHFPVLLDSSKPGTEFSERYFIVIEKAPGINLNAIAEAARGEASLSQDSISPPEEIQDRIILQAIRQLQTIPDLLLIRILLGILYLFDFIHTHSINSPDLEAQGLIWNDVKPDHLFWEPKSHQLTVIDWGNGQPLSFDGTTPDRHFSIVNDYSQFIQSLGIFVEQVNPSLYTRLTWPSNFSIANLISQSIKDLRANLELFLEEENGRLQFLREQEKSLLLTSYPTMISWDELENCQRQIQNMGELPDWKGAEKFATQLAALFVNEGNRNKLLEVCQKVSHIPEYDRIRWEIVQKIIQINIWPSLFPLPGQQALLSAIDADWPGTLWYLRLAAGDSNLPNWWSTLCDLIRQAQPEIGKNSLTPLVSLNRLILTLQSQMMKKPPVTGVELLSTEKEQTISSEPNLEDLVSTLKNKIARRWIELEPDPPNAGLEYTEIAEQIERIGMIEPPGKESLTKALCQPNALVEIILASWGRREFETARRGLRRLLLWDPDRQRVFLADKAISKAGTWLDQIQNGPESDESLHEFITRLELHGREIRNQVGAAGWLDQSLNAFSRLRRGASPADILLDFPDLRSELPWLLNYHPPRLRPSSGPILLERNFSVEKTEWRLSETRIGSIGNGGELLLGEPLDTWASEARGSSARVFSGKLRADNQNYLTAAIKVMRPGKADYSLPLFQEEVQVLALMKDVPGVITPYEFGFIYLGEGYQIPEDDTSQSALDLQGDIFRINPLDVQTFLAEIRKRADSGWLPYIALPVEERRNNLIYLCDAGYTHGRFLSLKENLRMVIQILDILQLAHSRNIVYRDHKILHYYWSEEENGIKIIDWNVARRAAQGLSLVEKGADLVQFSARALHHILTGRPAPGALPVGPTRPDEIDQAANAYSPQWTFDDQRLPTRLKDIIQQALVGFYQQPSSLREELGSLFHDLPDEA